MGANESRETREEKRSAYARNKGIYYSTIDDVWNGIPYAFGVADWEALRRTPAQVAAVPLYIPVLEGMSVDDDPALGSTRSQSIDASTPDILGFPGKLAQGAHFIPHNKTCAVAFGPISEMALGQNISPCDPEGTKKRHRLVVGVMETQGPNKRQKKDNTGLKHSRLNKLRIKGQKEYMENRPCLLIIPLLTLEETKAWKLGDPYSALYCLGGYSGDTQADSVAVQVVGAEVLTGFFPRCTREDLMKATGLLSAFTKGLAYSLCSGE